MYGDGLISCIAQRNLNIAHGLAQVEDHYFAEGGAMKAMKVEDHYFADFELIGFDDSMASSWSPG
eukprot:9685801-Heterocapsa_arctica.AAC.1